MNRPPPPHPSPFAPDDDWRLWREARRKHLPPWSYDRDWLTCVALESLPRVCAQLGTGPAVAFIDRPAWWRWGACGDGTVTAAQRILHGLGPAPAAVVVAVPLVPGSASLLLIDRSTAEWDCPDAGRFGRDLVELAAWRWNLPAAKAAWRLARVCGLQRPAP